MSGIWGPDNEKMECDQYIYHTGDRYGSPERMRTIGPNEYNTGSSPHNGDRKRNYNYNFNTDTSNECLYNDTNNNTHHDTNNGTHHNTNNNTHDNTNNGTHK